MADEHSLSLSREEMLALGYRVIDLLVEHFEQLPNKFVTQKATRQEMESRLREPIPEQGMDSDALMTILAHEVMGNMMHLDHPRFFAFVPGPSNYVSVLADALASGFNVFASTWLEASGPAQVELVVADWLRQACGLPSGAGGLFVSGGSMANLTALAVARHIKLRDQMADAVIYCSDQTHSSVERGLRVLGFQDSQIRKLVAGGGFRLDVRDLRAAVSADRDAGRAPFCVVANAGTTNTGAIDPLADLADYCRSEGLWLHVDGAYGAAAALCPQGRSLLEGLGYADSLVIDPHKWLFQPYEIGCVLVREERWLRDCFHILPEYLTDIERGTEEVNFCDRGIQLTRSFRALKLWLSVKRFGRAGFAAAMEYGMDLAERAEGMVRANPNWEVVSPAQLGVLAVRFVRPGLTQAQLDDVHHRLVDAMIVDGYAMVATTVLRGVTVLRLCTINPRTTEADLRETLVRLDRFAKQLVET